VLNRIILAGSVYRLPRSSIFYRALESGDYGLEVFEDVCSDLLFLYGDVFILGNFNVALLDPGHVLFAPFSGVLCSIMLLFSRRRRGGCLVSFWTCSCWCE
jgi:hypothetical protein